VKRIRAYCIRDQASAGTARSVCFLLDEEHAKHTLRTFMRGQGSDAVMVPMSRKEATSLLAGGKPARNGTRGRRNARA
jgi:hypothetical protein